MEEIRAHEQHDINVFKAIDAVLNTEGAGIFIMAYPTGKILFANRAMELYLCQADVKDAVEKMYHSNQHAGVTSPCPFCARVNLLDRDGHPIPPHIREEYVEGPDLWLKIIDQVTEWIDGSLIRIVTLYDITETKKTREQCAEFLLGTRLLGLKNGICLERDIREAYEKPSLLLIDVLSMRNVHEMYRWEVGEYLLCKIRDTIRAQSIPNSELYRIGIERFCLTVGGISRSELKRLADSMSDLLAGTWKIEYEGTAIQTFNHLTVAVIHSIYLSDDESPLSMIERILARARVRKKIAVYNRRVDEEHKDRLKLELDLKRCVYENMRGFDLCYQPIVAPDGETWCGLEALCRWSSLELGPVSPAVFIPEAERLELMGQIDLWVLETAVKQCKEWGLDSCDPFILNVNLSAAQLWDESLAEKMIQILKRHDFPGGKLCIEITESTSITFLNQSLRTVEQLRNYDVLIALDDFGTGYSSFSRLTSMPVDIVKIERTFVLDIENSEYHRYLFHTMVDLAHVANMILIAEGVERRRQMDILVGVGADYLQGYLFGKPTPAKDLAPVLSRAFRQAAPISQGAQCARKDALEDETLQPAES